MTNGCALLLTCLALSLAAGCTGSGAVLPVQSPAQDTNQRHIAAMTATATPNATRGTGDGTDLATVEEWPSDDASFRARLASDSAYATQVAQADAYLADPANQIADPYGGSVTTLLRATSTTSVSTLNSDYYYTVDKTTSAVRQVQRTSMRSPESYLRTAGYDYWLDQPRVADTYIQGHAYIAATCGIDWIWGWLPVEGCGVGHAGLFFAGSQATSKYFGENYGWDSAQRQDDPKVLNVGTTYYHFNGVETYESTDEFVYGIVHHGFNVTFPPRRRVPLISPK
jgi:hypothetical protein